jgi:two-component system, chemotaxis family, protein-glutamate methylesterase/glutaminase
VATVHVAGAVPPPPLRVVVVAATIARARQLERLLAGPGFAVVGVARGAEESERLVAHATPAAVLIDLDLPAGGLDAIERIMATRATPIVVVGDAAGQPEAALAAGAVDVVGPLDVAPGAPEYAEALRRHLAMASRVPVITHPRARLRARAARNGDSASVAPSTPPSEPAAAPAAPSTNGATASASNGSAPGAPATGDDAALADHSHARHAVRKARPAVVAIGASTGGPPALATILRDLPADLDAAVLVVQHMAEGFLDGLARWLDEASPLDVKVAADGDRLHAGRVYLAPAGRNMLLRPGYRLELTEPAVGQFHVPGVDATFHSVARVCGRRAVGVLLTGMGRDGAVGLQAIRAAGAATLGQDESTCVVYGMPAAARALGAVDAELPLTEVAPAVAAAVLGIHEQQPASRSAT